MDSREHSRPTDKAHLPKLHFLHLAGSRIKGLQRKLLILSLRLLMTMVLCESGQQLQPSSALKTPHQRGYKHNRSLSDICEKTGLKEAELCLWSRSQVEDVKRVWCGCYKGSCHFVEKWASVKPLPYIW